MSKKTVTSSELIERLADKTQLSPKIATLIVKSILGRMSTALKEKERIEIRGFGSFECKHQEAHKARNPKTGETVEAPAKYRIHFKPGKALKERINAAKRTK